MKKALALMLALAFCAACFVLTTGAAAPADEFSFLPEEGSNATITPTGCTYKINDNGSVTITLTAATGSLAVVYNDGTILQEKNINMKEDGQYILTSWTTTGSAVLGDVLVKHNRKDKDNADLYKTGMASSATYFEVNEDNYTAWDWRAYLNQSGGTRMPDDGVIECISATFPFTGAVGDTITLYRWCVASSIPEDLGKEAEAWATEDESSEPADVSSAAESEAASVAESEAASVAESEAASSAAASSAAESSKTPVTGDAGVAAIVVLAVVAAAGAAVIIRKRG